MKFSIITLCICLIVAACTRNDSVTFKNQGVLIGYDQRYCPSPACGGLLITIDNDTAANPPSYYHVNSTLARLGISETTKMPVHVSFEYSKDTGVYAAYDYIVITKIKVK